jgi:plastocyanin
MKKIKLLSFVIPVLTFVIFFSASYAGTINIGVQDYSFSPANRNAVVGDTIVWTWISGIHTTTSTTIPAGAASWDSPITSTQTSFSYVVTMSGTYNYECTRHASMGMTGAINVSLTGIKELNQIINDYRLNQNYPNPFNPSTKISFSIPKEGNVTLKVFDINGKEVATLINQRMNAGTFETDFNAQNVSSGIYYYRIKSEDFTDTKKMVVMK